MKKEELPYLKIYSVVLYVSGWVKHDSQIVNIQLNMYLII